MTHISPGASLSWAIYSVLFEGFLLYHLYNFDKFKCLKWNSVNQPGAFKRLMTYTYLSTLPLLIVYSVSSAVIKYREGYIMLPLVGVIVPKPYTNWSPATQSWIIPLYYVLGEGWALEMTTHLEELFFWFFLLHQSSKPRRWFSSIEFKLWVGGALTAITIMPVVVFLTRSDPLKCEAWLFFTGSAASTATTLPFLYILYQFPRFLTQIRNDGAESHVVARLSTFHQLNIVRVAFRFLFTLPLLALSVDGIRAGHQHPVNENPLWTDLFIMVSGLGSAISSCLTLFIFFPKSDNYEPPKHQQEEEEQGHTKTTWVSFDEEHYSRHESRGDQQRSLSPNPHLHVTDWNRRSDSGSSTITFTEDHYYPPGGSSVAITSASNRHREPHVTPGELENLSPSPLHHARKRSATTSAIPYNQNALHTSSVVSASNLHPYISNFTSPIDLADDVIARAI